MVPDLSNINGKVATSISSVGAAVTKGAFINAVGYLLLGLVVVGCVIWGIYWWGNKRKFNRIIVAHEIINGYFDETFRDLARPVRLGKGGFEIIYLKKLKTWKLAHGARSGRNRYKMYIMPDGYWYPGQIQANIYQIDKSGGLIPVVTTNPSMRSQYTALEKQIDQIHGEKTSFWKEYAPWILGAVYISIIGIFSWLSYREIGQFLGSGSVLADKMVALADAMNKLAINLNSAQPNGVIQAR